MAFIVSGVSIGDWEKGFLSRVLIEGSSIGYMDALPSLDELKAIMLEQHDDREHDATDEQWIAAYQAFTLAYMEARERFEQEAYGTCDCGERFYKDEDAQTTCYSCQI